MPPLRFCVNFNLSGKRPRAPRASRVCFRNIFGSVTVKCYDTEHFFGVLFRIVHELG